MNLYVLEAQILAVLVTCLWLPKLTAKLEQINLTRNAHFCMAQFVCIKPTKMFAHHSSVILCKTCLWDIVGLQLTHMQNIPLCFTDSEEGLNYGECYHGSVVLHVCNLNEPGMMFSVSSL